MNTQEQETWCPIRGFEGLYDVSNCGNVRSLSFRNRVTPVPIPRVKLMRQTPDKDGYLALQLNGHTRRLVHRLVAEAFIPNPDSKRTVNHKNGIKTDNRAENLEWMTLSENHIHAYKLGLRKAPLAKLTPDQVREIRCRLKTGEMGSVIAADYPVTQNQISQIKHGRIWRSVV